MPILPDSPPPDGEDVVFSPLAERQRQKLTIYLTASEVEFLRAHAYFYRASLAAITRDVVRVWLWWNTRRDDPRFAGLFSLGFTTYLPNDRARGYVEALVASTPGPGVYDISNLVHPSIPVPNLDALRRVRGLRAKNEPYYANKSVSKSLRDALDELEALDERTDHLDPTPIADDESTAPAPSPASLYIPSTDERNDDSCP